MTRFYWFIKNSVKLTTGLLFRVRMSGHEHIPPTGAVILAVNHISYYDPPLIGSWVPREIHFFAKEELFRNRLFGGIIRALNAFPVRRGTIDRRALEKSQYILRSGGGLLVFPEGTRSKTDNLLDPKPGIGLLAKAVRCPIVPGCIVGSNNLWRCFIGRKKLRLHFGSPFPADWLDQFEDSRTGYEQIASQIMTRIGALRQEVPA